MLSEKSLNKNRGLQAREWKEFQTHISSFSVQDQADIEHAYCVAEAAHRGQNRRSGERYFSHPRECAIILIEAGVNWSRPIILALLHDVPEDTDYLDLAYVPKQESLVSPVWDRIAGSFDEETASMLESLTEVKPDAYLSKKEAEEISLLSLKSQDREVLLVKMADRLHNLRTLKFMPGAKQEAKLRETKRKYLPIFKQAIEVYPEIAGKLLGQIEVAIRVIEAER